MVTSLPTWSVATFDFQMAAVENSRISTKARTLGIPPWQHRYMGNRPSTPDLFSPMSAREPSSSTNLPSSPEIAHSAASSRRHVLPSDLPTAIKQLEDLELDQLLSAVLAEQKRRGKKQFVSGKGQQREHKVDASLLALTGGRINAVRSAFKAGVTPSRIARQFGLSLSDVRKALASDPKR
jgi:hypothetical protein